VLRARTGRLVVAWVLFSLTLLFELVGLVGEAPTPAAGDVLDLALTGATVASLAVFCSSDYFRRQRSGAGSPPAIGGLLVIAVVVGALGGLTAPATGDGPGVHVHVGL
jgi:hypothetical protein